MKMVTAASSSSNPHVIAMPRWSSFVGIARLVLAILVLAFVAAAAGLWGSAEYAAFGLTLFTVRTLSPEMDKSGTKSRYADTVVNTGISNPSGLRLLYSVALPLAIALLCMGCPWTGDFWCHFLAYLVRTMCGMDCRIQPLLVDAWQCHGHKLWLLERPIPPRGYRAPKSRSPCH